MDYLPVIPHIKTYSVPNADVAREQQGFTIEEVLFGEWDCDAHFATYYLQNGVERLYARILKQPVAKYIEGPHKNKRGWGLSDWRKHDFEAMMGLMVVEYDNPKHTPWKAAKQARGELNRQLGILAEHNLTPRYSYTTRAGVRHIWELDEPLPVDDGEQALSGLVDYLIDNCGIPIDLGCLDWTRFFRAPNAQRDGAQLGDQAWFSFLDHAESHNQLIGAALPRINPRWLRDKHDESKSKKAAGLARSLAAGLAGPAAALDLGDAPDDETALGLVWSGERARPLTPVGEALLENAGQSTRAQILRHKAPAAGTRDTALMSLIGAICGAAEKVPDAEAEHALGLILPITDQLEPDRDTPDWKLRAWNMIERLWARTVERRDAIERTRKKAKAQYAVTKGEIEERQDSLFDSYRRNNPEITRDMDDDDLTAHLASTAVVGRAPNDCYFLLPNGEYYPHKSHWSRCVTRVAETAELAEVAENYGVYIESRGEYVPAVEPKHFHSLGAAGHIDSIHYSAARASGLFYDEESGFTLSLPIHRIRTDIPAVFHDEVHQWLEALFEDESDAAFKWLMFCSYADRPIAGLLLQHQAHSGKSLIAHAVANMWTKKGPCQDIGVSNFNAEIQSCPVWFYDERLPARADNVKRFDAFFREKVVGGWMKMERKGVDAYRVEVYPRFIFCSNKGTIAESLFGNEDLSVDDTEALAERLIMVDVGPRAKQAVMLLSEACGGHRPTILQKATEHLFWLREQADFSQIPSHSRFMVDGLETSNDPVRRAAIRSTTARSVIEFLLQRVRDHAITKNKTHVGICKGQLQIMRSTIIKKLPEAIFGFPRGVAPDQLMFDTLDKAGVLYQSGRAIRLNQGTARNISGVRIDLGSLYRVCKNDPDLNVAVDKETFEHLMRYCPKTNVDYLKEYLG